MTSDDDVSPMGLLLNYAFMLVGRRYKWGGDDPLAGFDCSGLVVELLTSVGLMPHGQDMNCQQIYQHFVRQGAKTVSGPGALAFYGKSISSITHIGFCVDYLYMIEAGGGDSSTHNEGRAIEQNAFVRMRPVRYRKDLLTLLRPTYPWEEHNRRGYDQ